MAKLRRQIIADIARHVMASARKTYGPDHPDAQVSRLERRP